MKYRPPKLIQTPPARTLIDERREREAYDKAHPWQSMASAIINDGVVCELLFSDLADVAARYFLAEDDHWYQIDPPEQISKSPWGWRRRPMNWRPTNRKLTPEKRAEIIRKAHRSTYSGGRYIGDEPSW